MRKAWLGVELRHLAALAAVAEERSFRGAADALGYVQSAVSQQIAHLEQLLEVRLVERRRGPGPVTLTEAGELLLAHTGSVLDLLEAARADLDLLKDGRAGSIRLGISDSLAIRLLPALVPRFHRGSPSFQLEITEAITDEELWELLGQGKLEAAICRPAPSEALESAELLEDPFVLLTGASEVTAASVTPEGLSALPLIDHCLMREVEAQLRPYGFEPRYVFHSEVHGAVQGLVAAGVGAAIVPRLGVDEADPETTTWSLEGLLAPLAVALCWHRERRLSPGLDSLLEATRQVCAQHSARPDLQLAS